MDQHHPNLLWWPRFSGWRTLLCNEKGKILIGRSGTMSLTRSSDGACWGWASSHHMRLLYILCLISVGWAMGGWLLCVIPCHKTNWDGPIPSNNQNFLGMQPHFLWHWWLLHLFYSLILIILGKWNSRKWQNETRKWKRKHCQVTKVTHILNNKLEKWSFKHGLLPMLQQTLEFVVSVQNNCSSDLFIEAHQICKWPLTSTEPIESTLTSMRELIQQVTSLCLALNKAFCGRLGESSPVAKCRE